MSVTLKPKILFIGYGHLAKSLASNSFLKNFKIDSINSKSRIYSLNRKKIIKKLNPPYKYVFLLIRPNLFYQRGTENKWVIDFIGGGACWNSYTCGKKQPTFIDSVEYIRKRASNAEGIYDHKNPNNPVKDWNHIIIPY